MPDQLVFPFGLRPAHGRQDFIIGPCNEQAFRFIERWPDWPARSAAIYGPPGSGKTHLAHVWQVAAEAIALPASALSSWRALLGPAGTVAIEDMDNSSPSPERDRALLELFEQPSCTLLLTGRVPPLQWPAAIGDLRSRFDALLAFPIWAPDETLLLGLVRKHFADRQLEVPEAIATRILTHVERTPEAVAAFVARADARALSEKRAVTQRLVVDLIEAEEGRTGG